MQSSKLEASDVMDSDKSEGYVNLNQLLSVGRNVNQIIVREKDRDRLLKRICETLTEFKGYHYAWIALLDEDGVLTSSAESGLDDMFNLIVESIDRGEKPPCVGRALEETGVHMVEDPASFCVDCPLVEKFPDRNRLYSRLEHGAKVYGVLGVSTSKETLRSYGAKVYEQSLFNEVVDDISYALNNLEVEEERKKTAEALEKSEAILKEAQRISHLGNWDWNIATNDLWWSDEIYRIFGLSPQEFGATYESFLNSVHSDDREFVKKSVDDALYKKIPYSIDHKIVLPDGSERIVHEQAEVFYDESSIPIRMLGTIQDITERKKMEDELRKERDKAQKYLATAGVIMVALDKDGRVSLLNRKGCEVLGYTEKEALGKSWFETFLPARIRNQIKAEFKSLIAGKIKDIEYYENSVLTRNGEERLIAWNNTVLRDYEGRVLGTLSSGNDITERKQFEEELKKERDTAQKYLASLESIFVSSPNAITVTDLNGNIVECNPEALKISGFASKDELISKNAFELIAVKDRKQALENLRKTLEYDSVKNIEYTLLTKDGREYPAEFSVSVIKDSKGKPTGFVAVIQDIADRKKVEEEIRIKDSAIASSINAIAFADLEGNLTYVNSSFLELWGYEDDKEVIGEPSVKFWQMEEKASEIVEVLRDKGRWMGELMAKRKDGSSFDVQISANTVEDETGKSICMMASFIDITKRKEMEEIKTNSAYISHGIKPGESYISDSHDKAYKAYADLVMHGVSGLCFLRENPTEFTQKYRIDREKIYILSSRHVKDFKHIDDIQEISLSLGKFLKNNGKSIVLLSGLEYLISRFGFPTIFKFIQEKRLDAFEVNSTILFPVHIEALDKKEAALLNSELKTLR